MGKHKHKQKKKPTIKEVEKQEEKERVQALEEKQVSEADAAAGLMAPARKAAVSNVKEKEKEKDDTTSTTLHQKRQSVLENETQQQLTRKQKRQKLNDKNKWPQHPKIKDAVQREKAYLRVAGIEAITETQEEETKFPSPSATKPLLPQDDDDDDDDTEWRRFGRFLGGTDARTRHRAVKRLSQYLQAKSGYGLNGSKLDNVVGLSELDLLKLWKGLWFTLYMADKVPVQDELAKHIAKLMWCVAGDQETDEFAAQAYLDMEAKEETEMESEQHQKQKQQLTEEDGEGEAGDEDEDEDDDDDEDFKILDTRVVETEYGEEEGSDDDDDDDDDNKEEEEETGQQNDNDKEEEEEDTQETPHIRGAPLAMMMMRTFFRTLVREWGKMDKYRVDKFYTLVRYMVREIYRYMAQRQWSLGIIRLFNDAITEEALIQPPNGVRYHLIDIALEELVLVATKSGVVPLTEAIFLEVLEPYFNMAQHGFGDKTVQARVVEKVLEKFLLEYSVVSESEDKNKILEEVHVGTVSKFIFEIGSTEDTLDIHRKSLYDMHKAYERQRKKTGTDIEIDAAFQNLEEDAEEEDEDYATEDMDAEADKEEESLEQMGFVEEESGAARKEDKEGVEASIQVTEETKKDKKKKKKKRKKEKQEADNQHEESNAEAPVTPTEGKVGEKNKKEKRAAKGDMDTTHHGDGVATRREKKQKKRKHDDDESDDDIVTISMAAQKKAKQAFKQKEEPSPENDDSDNEKSKKKRKKSKKKDKKEGGDKPRIKRRVSFDNNNRARSWKASMKGLQHLDTSEAASKTPEKSILLNKDKKSPINKSNTPKGRKRAMDYF